MKEGKTANQVEGALSESLPVKNHLLIAWPHVAGTDYELVLIKEKHGYERRKGSRGGLRHGGIISRETERKSKTQGPPEQFVRKGEENMHWPKKMQGAKTLRYSCSKKRKREGRKRGRKNRLCTEEFNLKS